MNVYVDSDSDFLYKKVFVFMDYHQFYFAEKKKQKRRTRKTNHTLLIDYKTLSNMKRIAWHLYLNTYSMSRNLYIDIYWISVDAREIIYKIILEELLRAF